MILCLVFFSGCGKKSKVSPLFSAIPLRQSHGDGKLAVFTVKLPLSERSLDPVDSPIDPTTGAARVPLLGDVLLFITQATFNVGTEFGLGNQTLVLKQPLPALEQGALNSISIKRVFFHIDQVEALQASHRRGILWALDEVRGFIFNSRQLDFSFIKDLRIHMGIGKTQAPITSYEGHRVKDTAELAALAAEDRSGPPKLDILRYSKKGRAQYLLNRTRGKMFVMYSEDPVDTQTLLQKDPFYKEVIKETVIVNKTLVVELLDNSRLITEKFYSLMERIEGRGADLKISKIEACSESICLDVKVNQTNLMPLLVRGNELRIETQMNIGKVPPKSFQLKGFIEFEIKLDLKI